MATTTMSGPGSRASARYLHVSAYKVRQVLELIRGLPVEDAERVLELCEKDAADDVLKILRAATANAEHNHTLPADELFVARAWADEGPTRKWGQPRARGRYFRVRKRTAHVTIVLERFEVEDLEERRRRDETSGRGSAAAQRQRAERVRRSRGAQAEPEPERDADDEEDVAEVAEADAETAPVDEAETEAAAETSAESEDDADRDDEEEK